ncbi:hypothetical protein ACJMK2_011115 [Sinanodonta woodiana]|uniref:DNA-repair protein Xrcc1 N-terminal domain-containing protein n=1 Tax=Sinanodonta woodiana TaxID=1069815 RepID=A0ABD3V599_SINWO
MAPVPLKFVVSFTSQDENYPVQNLIHSDGFKKWLSHPKDKCGQIEAVFQLEHECTITYIDIGTIWCSTLELRVGRSDWPTGREYQLLCPTVKLMSPAECRTGKNVTFTRMFTQVDFCEEAANGSWDRLKVICRQNFRKDVQFGLTFLCVKSGNISFRKEQTGGANLSNAKSTESIQKHFFGKSPSRPSKPHEALKSKLLKIAGSSENGVECDESLSRTAKLVLAASESTVKPWKGQSPNPDRKSLYSNHVEQKNGLSFEDETESFLSAVNINEQELDQITIADLRHKFEKKKYRKLTSDEKRIFKEMCRRFICAVFGEENVESDGSVGVISPVVKPENVLKGQREENTKYDGKVSKCKIYTSNENSDLNRNSSKKSGHILTSNSSLQKLDSSKSFLSPRDDFLPNGQTIDSFSPQSSLRAPENEYSSPQDKKRKTLPGTPTLNRLLPETSTLNKMSPGTSAINTRKTQGLMQSILRSKQKSKDGRRTKKAKLDFISDEEDMGTPQKSPWKPDQITIGNQDVDSSRGRGRGRGQGRRGRGRSRNIAAEEICPTGFTYCLYCSASFPPDHAQICPNKTNTHQSTETDSISDSCNSPWLSARVGPGYRLRTGSPVQQNINLSPFNKSAVTLQHNYRSVEIQSRDFIMSSDSDDSVSMATDDLYVEEFAECPICHISLPAYVIQEHANVCLDSI